MRKQYLAGVAQRIRASDYGSEGWGFESLRPHQPDVKNFKAFRTLFAWSRAILTSLQYSTQY